jgi:hypothetical protein
MLEALIVQFTAILKSLVAIYLPDATVSYGRGVVRKKKSYLVFQLFGVLVG